MTSYVREINSIDEEIKRLNTRLKTLRQQKKTAQGHLYEYMNNKNIEKIENFTLKKLEPKPPKPKKKKAEKMRDAIILCSQHGIDDPEEFYKQFQKTQTAVFEE